MNGNQNMQNVFIGNNKEVVLPLSNPSQVLSLNTKTWSRDSHGLYDYESTQVKQASLVVTENSLMYRKKQEIKLNPQLEGKDEEFLMEVKCERTEKYYLRNSVPVQVPPSEQNINDLQNKIWYVIRHEEAFTNNSTNTSANSNEDYHICLNDIIKLGRVKYAANEINIQNSTLNSTELSGPYNMSNINLGTKPVFDFIYKSSTPPESIIEEITCKFCLSGLSDEENPLVNLCKCTGGIKYTHYACTKLWMQTKLSKKENEKVTSYNIKSFNCEICKTPFPFRFVVNNNSQKIYDLIDIIRPENQSYIILESLNQVKENNNIKSIHVINLSDQKITLGRGHESDVRINDISVSRTHATITFNPENGKICIRDLKSKFGTLVLIKTDLLVKDKKIYLQIGRTYLDANVVNLKEMRKNKERKVANMNLNQEFLLYDESNLQLNEFNDLEQLKLGLKKK